MSQTTTFNSHLILKQQINESNFSTFLVGFDLKDDGTKEYRLKPFVSKLLDAIHEFAFGYHAGSETDNTETLEKVTEAAKSIYKIDEFQKAKDLYLNDGEYEDDLEEKYLKRGEFGELILHLILRDFYQTIPLLSKIYFKDSRGHTVHGFDSVHIEPETKTLWLGESKLYTDGKKGLTELIKDVKDHIKSEYLNDEFILISKKLKMLDNIQEKEYWLQLLSSSEKLQNQLSRINIPLLCTYQCKLFDDFDDEEAEEFVNNYVQEMGELQKYFHDRNDHPLKSEINIILILFPIQNKKSLVKALHHKLSLIQSIKD